MIGKQPLGISDKHSWTMFRGSSMRTGASASKISRKPSLLWVTEVGPSVSSPIFGDGTIYVSTITGRIFALNPSEKQIKWHLNVGSPLVSSPLLHNSILVAATYDSWIKDASFTGKNFVLGINTEDGKQIWGYEIPGDVFSSPCLVEDAIIVVGSMNNGIYALEGYSGNVRWKFETGGEVWSSPSYNGNEIFIGSDDGFLYCLDIDGKLRWKTKLNGKIRSSSPCLSFDEGQSPSVFIGTYNGGMFCLNQSTGMIRWSKQIPKPVMASPATIKDKVFFAASDKRIYCFQVKDGSRIWDFETGDKIWSSPSLSEYAGVMFFGSLDSHIYGIDINTGRQTWKFPTMSIVDSSAAIASNMMLIGSRDGLLYVFGSETTPSYIR
ncbi:MAG: PQQ-binding-like beta-propeller repeat protein [Thermoproteota archaeon]|nr:PQQ-binding-like beta-propeller repeat protein [Thermoproteota archaeon]